MNPERWQQVRQLLDRAIAAPDGQRAALLDAACSDDSELRNEVESLLRSHQQAGSVFLQRPALDLNLPGIASADNSSRVGRRVGVYRLIELIGQGGMGDVYRAERADGQYDKQVAIKFVRAGLDTAAILERFRHERQVFGLSRSSQRRPPSRRWHHRRGDSLSCDGADRRHSDRSVL